LSPLRNMNLTPAPPKRDYKNPLLKDPYSRVSPVKDLSIVTIGTLKELPQRDETFSTE
jgi:hypothetical protein